MSKLLLKSYRYQAYSLNTIGTSELKNISKISTWFILLYNMYNFIYNFKHIIYNLYIICMYISMYIIFKVIFVSPLWVVRADLSPSSQIRWSWLNAFFRLLSLLIFGDIVNTCSSNSSFTIFFPLKKTVTTMMRKSL